jgi:hypothetical protein
MAPLLVAALRRMAWYVLGLALALVVVFKVLPVFGIIGPSAEDQIGWAAQALETARAYGAGPEQPAFAAAAARLEEARKLLLAQRGREARSAALAAREQAVGAQRAALAMHEEQRRRARRLVDEVDGLLNDLEDLYTDVSQKAGKDKLPELPPIMKDARQASAALFLGFEQQSYRRVIDDEPAVRKRLEEAKASLEGARRKR